MINRRWRYICEPSSDQSRWEEILRSRYNWPGTSNSHRQLTDGKSAHTCTQMLCNHIGTNSSRLDDNYIILVKTSTTHCRNKKTEQRDRMILLAKTNEREKGTKSITGMLSWCVWPECSLTAALVRSHRQVSPVRTCSSWVVRMHKDSGLTTIGMFSAPPSKNSVYVCRLCFFSYSLLTQ